MIVLPSLCAIVLGYLYTPLAIVFLILLQVGHAYKEPVMAKLTQKELNDENRSTMASTTSFLSSIVVGLLLPVWGNTIDSVGLHTTSIYIGLFTFAIGSFALLLYVVRPKRWFIKSSNTVNPPSHEASEGQSQPGLAFTVNFFNNCVY